MFASDPPTRPTVAYFCMEFGLDARFTIYSGGLGILAGDHMKSASDLRLPVIGIGLLWDHGYVDQRLDEHGRPVDRYLATDRDGLEQVTLPHGGVEVTVRGETVPLIAWRVRRYLAGELYLLEPARHGGIPVGLGAGHGNVHQPVDDGHSRVRLPEIGRAHV